MNRAPEATSPTPATAHPGALRGVGLALASAVLYTATNICLRAAVHCDPYWVSCLKAVPTLLLVAPPVAWAAWQGRPSLPSLRVQTWLFLTGLLAHLGGNVAFQWGLGIVGLAAAVPLTFSMILVGGALLGRFWLGEGITTRSALCLALLCVAVALLGVHTETARPNSGPAAEPEFDPLTKGLAVASILISGIAYAVLGAVIRRTVTGTAGPAPTLFVISVAGVVSLGLISWLRLGTAGLAATTTLDLGIMLQGGLYNAVAFFMLTRALQLIPIAYVNVVNASQTALAAVAGVLFFREPTTFALVAGIGLMIVGIGLYRPARRGPGDEEC